MRSRAGGWGAAGPREKMRAPKAQIAKSSIARCKTVASNWRRCIETKCRPASIAAVPVGHCLRYQCEVTSSSANRRTWPVGVRIFDVGNPLAGKRRRRPRSVPLAVTVGGRTDAPAEPRGGDELKPSVQRSFSSRTNSIGVSDTVAVCCGSACQ